MFFRLPAGPCSARTRATASVLWSRGMCPHRARSSRRRRTLVRRAEMATTAAMPNATSTGPIRRRSSSVNTYSQDGRDLVGKEDAAQRTLRPRGPTGGCEGVLGGESATEGEVLARARDAVANHAVHGRKVALSGTGGDELLGGPLLLLESAARGRGPPRGRGPRARPWRGRGAGRPRRRLSRKRGRGVQRAVTGYGTAKASPVGASRAH